MIGSRNMDKIWPKLIFILGLGLVLFLATYKLTESPPVWLDEGVFTQVAINLAQFGEHSIMTGPGNFVSAWFATTGYSVTVPIALTFKIFGINLFVARSLMAVFIILMALVSYFLIKKEFDWLWASLSLLLLATFAPLYGNGKSVLGEVPGLFFLVSALFFLNISQITKRKSYYLFTGVLIGLCVITKPIFLVLIPAVIGAFYLKRKTIPNLIEQGIFLSLGFGLALIPWLLIQFSGSSLVQVFGHYANPYDLPFKIVLLTNLKQFISEAQPIYFLLLFVVWLLAYFRRFYKKQFISLTETTALVFSVLIFIAYFRIEGHYRYFFPAQVLALIYLPNSLGVLFFSYSRKIIVVIVVILIIFQSYQTIFHSWVATYYQSTRSAEITNTFSSLPKTKKIFIYQAPETVVFLAGQDYYQFFQITKLIVVGQDNLKMLMAGEMDFVVVPISLYQTQENLFKPYLKFKEFGKYLLLTKNI